MSEHNLILEFYKPTYNLDFDYDGDGGLDLHFTNIKGEFFMTMNDSYNSVYIENEDCEFSKGEMFATVDLGDLVERIISGEFRQTNGKAVSDWGKRFIGDGEKRIEFNGKNYADGSLFWDDFFKEMPKDEIKDFLKFCESYIYLPNIEVDTVSDKWDFENGKVELKSNGKWGITVNDDYTIFSVESFTCDSTDACNAYDVASSESDEDDFYESKKSAKRSLKERGRYDYDVIDILSTLFKYANYESDGLDLFKNPTYKVLWHDNVSEHGIQAYAKGMEEIYDIMFYNDYSILCISKNVPKYVFDEKKSLKESKLYTYMIGVEPEDWTIDDAKACKKYGIICKGYYVLGNYEGMVLVGTLSDIENYVENYFGAGIAEDYLCPYDIFDFEDGEWITGSWF